MRSCCHASRIPTVVALLAVAVPLLADEPPREANDPLPKGAIVRFGVTRPILRKNPAVGLIAPQYTNFLAPTMTGGIRRYDLATGRPLDNRGIVGPGTVVVSADGKRAAVARLGTINVVEVATGQKLLGVVPPEGVVVFGTPAISLSPDGKILAYGGKGQDNRGAAVVLDVDKNEVLAVCDTHQLAPVQVTLSRDARTLATYGPPIPAPRVSRTGRAQAPGPRAARWPAPPRRSGRWRAAGNYSRRA